MNRGHARIEAKKGRRGVTLVELLIAIAIFSLLMASIVAVFVSSLRAARAGRQAIDAFEESRGAFDLVQRDLMTAFTSRDYAQYYSFFGMPYGFMFVGLARGQRATDPDANLARVTYVLRRMPNQPQFETTAIDSLSGDTVDVTVETCSLLRYVEMDVADLDTFVFVPDGSATADGWDDLSGEWPAVGDILADVRDRYEPNPTEPIEYPATPIQAKAIQEKMVSAMKCELWIRMLAESTPPAGQLSVPELYREMWLEADAEDPATQPYTPLPVIDDPSGPYGDLPDIWARIDKDPEDYVVADNIFFRAYRSDDPTQATIESGIYISPVPDRNLSVCYFQYGRQHAVLNANPAIVAEMPTILSPFWITESNATTRTLGTAPVLIESPDLNAQLGSPLVPRIPEILKMRLTFLLESPYPGAPDFRRQLEQVIDVPAGYVRTRRN